MQSWLHDPEQSSENASAPTLIHGVRWQKSPAISILVRILNEVECLPEFWRRLRLQSIFDETEIVFLDSGSTDGTVEYLMQQRCLVYQIPRKMFNFGRSCNQLAELATAPILVLLSAHVLLVEDNLLQCLVETLIPFERDAVYLRQVPNDVFGFSIYEAAYLARRFPGGNSPVTLTTPGSFSNAASAFTRVAWEAQRFPEIHGSEDFIWAKAHLQAGGRLLYLPHLQVLHSHCETPDAVYRRVRLNAEARGLTQSYFRALFLFCGVFVSMMRKGASLREALRYSASHARAYL